MRSRFALLAVCAALPILLAAASGGFPSRPTFQHVTVRGVPTATGQIDARGAVAGSANVAYYAISDSTGTRQGYLGQGDASDLMTIANEIASGGLTLTTNGGTVSATGAVNVGNSTGNVSVLASDGDLRNRGTTNSSATNVSYVGFQQLNGTENGWVGFGDATSTLRLTNGISGANINLVTTGAGVVQANGERVASVISAFKSSPTTRTNTTTSTADPDLTFTLPVGSWEVSAFLLMDAVTTTTQGFRYQLNFAGTFDPALVVRCVDTRTSLLAAATVGVQGMNSDTLVADVSTANIDIAEIRCWLRASASGALQVRWAQEASSANGSRLNNGSWLVAKRLGS